MEDASRSRLEQARQATRENLEALLDGDARAAAEVLELALEQFVREIVRTSIALRTNDLGVLQSCAHALGATWHLFVGDDREVVRLPAALQRAARDGRPEALRLARDLNGYLHELLRDLLQEMPGTPAVLAPLDDAPDLREAARPREARR